MFFIEFTCNEKPILVNAANILHVQAMADVEQCVLYLTDHRSLYVDGTYEQIKQTLTGGIANG